MVGFNGLLLHARIVAKTLSLTIMDAAEQTKKQVEIGINQ
jgi:hypothetical protein